jgi:ribosomal protein S12 methylthiotransferase
LRHRFFLYCLGCPKNEVDAEGMSTLLHQAGWRQVSRPQAADVLIINTCGFIQAARDESYAALRELADAKQPGQVLVAAGCLAQRDAERLREQIPQIDGLLGTRDWPRIAAYVTHLSESASHHAALPGNRAECSLVASVERRPLGASAFIKIADGCSASCAFCAIPLIKGPQRSKARESIVREARELIEQRVREVVLIAQDATAYGLDRGEHDGLPSLLEELLAAVPQLPWLRVLYAYPQRVSPRLIEVMTTHSQVCHYLDLPLQHAHPDVLRRMNRPSDVDSIRRLVADVRQAMPDVALRTTFIVGYPGETDAEFAALLQFMAEVQFDKVGIFTFSTEEGTQAASLPNPVPPELAQQRYDQAMALQRGLSHQRNQSQVGRILEILVEGAEKSLSVGRSYRDAPEIDGYVLVRGRLRVGEIIPCRITAALEYDLEAVPAGS